MMPFGLFSADIFIANLVVVIRVVEVLMLLFYMRRFPFRMNGILTSLTLIAGLTLYTFVYEWQRNIDNFYNIFPIHLLHLLVWGLMIHALYRLPFKLTLSIDLIFFIITRSCRWAALSFYRASKIVTSQFYMGDALAYQDMWLYNLMAIIVVIYLASLLIPASKLVFNIPGLIFKSLLVFLYIYIRVNLDEGLLHSETYFEVAMILLAYVFILVTLFSFERLFVAQKNQQEQERILLMREAKYQNVLTKMEAESSMRRIYHDIHRHLSSIEALAQNNGKVRDYVSSIERELSKANLVVDTGDDLLDSILSERIQEAQQHEVSILADVDFRKVDFIDPIDICAIFSNAVDNAYEATQHLDEPNKRVIKVKGGIVDSFVVIKVSNYYKQALTQVDGEYLSTKSSGEYHGIGISSIKHSVHRYNGGLSISTDENQLFVMKILIPFPSNKKLRRVR